MNAKLMAIVAAVLIVILVILGSFSLLMLYPTERTRKPETTAELNLTTEQPEVTGEQPAERSEQEILETYLTGTLISELGMIRESVTGVTSPEESADDTGLWFSNKGVLSAKLLDFDGDSSLELAVVYMEEDTYVDESGRNAACYIPKLSIVRCENEVATRTYDEPLAIGTYLDDTHFGIAADSKALLDFNLYAVEGEGRTCLYMTCTEGVVYGAQTKEFRLMSCENGKLQKMLTLSGSELSLTMVEYENGVEKHVYDPEDTETMAAQFAEKCGALGIAVNEGLNPESGSHICYMGLNAVLPDDETGLNMTFTATDGTDLKSLINK